MKRFRHLLLLAAAVFCVTAFYGVNAKAQAIVGVSQTDASESSVKVKCNAVLREGSFYYFLQISKDKKTWYTKGVSDSANDLYARQLSAGSSWYARVGVCADYDWVNSSQVPTGIDASSYSAAIEVVTAPDDTNFKVYQSNATTSSVSVKGTGAVGANYYQLVYNNQVIGASTSSEVRSTAKLYAGTSYWFYMYPCRRSSSGFVAKAGYKSLYAAKTLMNKLSTKSMGITAAYTDTNIYNFGFSTSESSDGYQWQFLTPKGKVVKTFTDKNSIENFINGKMLKYRVRTYVKCGAARKYSAWSGCKYLGFTKKVSSKIVSKKYVKVTWSKLSNASGYTIYTSTKEKSKFKKLKSVSSKTKSVTIKKIAGKKLKKNKNYYVRIVPKAKVGKKSVTAGSYILYKFSIY